MMKHAEEGVSRLNANKQEPAGELRIAMPAFLATSSLSAKIGEFAVIYPQVTLSISFNDRSISLIEKGFDLAIRVGFRNSGDHNMATEKLGELKRILVCGRSFAAMCSTPKNLYDLQNWNWIGYTPRGKTNSMISPDEDQLEIAPR